jgi:superfamily II DNA or RNA helicase
MPVHAPRRGTVVRIRDERWSVCGHAPYRDAVVIDVRGCDRTNRGRHARFLLPFEQLQQLPASVAIRVVSRRRWKHLARQVVASATPACDSLRTLTSARFDLLAFQLEPALAVVRGVAARLLLADEVGLGKTVQAGLIVAEMLARAPQARVLVACPATLRSQWARELENRFGLQPVVLDSAALGYARPWQLSGRNPWSVHPLIVASIDYLKRPEVLRALEDLVWDALVVDEAHGVAGHSDRHAAVCVLGERARTLVLLTATPHSGNEESFQRLCSIGDFDRQFPLAVFRRTRADVGLASSRRTTWLQVRPTPAEIDMHRALREYANRVWHDGGERATRARLAMVVLLKRGCSSAASLARSVERRLLLLAEPGGGPLQLALPFTGDGYDDGEPGSDLAAPGLADPQAERTLLEAILRLAIIARQDESKLRRIRRLLQRTGERAIVFTEYRDTLASLTRELAPFGCIELHGGLTANEREQVLREFWTGAPRVLLATDAASEGVNLQQKCRMVINLEVPWSPLRLEQRVGRVDRIGQRGRVHQLTLVAGDTEEHRTIARLVRDRAGRAGKALDALRSPGIEEMQVAERIFGTEAVRHAPRVAADPDGGLLVVDLKTRARDEVARATVGRTLCSDRVLPVRSARPFAAAVDQRASRGCWVFKLDFLDGNDLVLWEALVGIAYAVDAPPRFHDPSHVLEHLGRSREAVTAAALRHHDALLSRVEFVLQVPRALAIAREEAIVSHLERRRARLAASLLQPLLFGPRRAERETAAQQTVVQEALGRCRERLARLSRQRAVSGTAELAFAVLLR